MLHAEEHRRAISRLAITYSCLAQLVAQKDHAALKQEFEFTRSIFQEKTTCALTEIDHVIDSLCIFLAATESKRKDGRKNQV
jgi:prephenate dehydrogenase/chorismate mutase/prephenate dehydrogenase